jgi:hypothetical protein
MHRNKKNDLYSIFMSVLISFLCFIPCPAQATVQAVCAFAPQKEFSIKKDKQPFTKPASGYPDRQNPIRT